MDGEIGLGELSRNFVKMEQRIDKQLDEIKSQINSLQFVQTGVYEIAHKELEGRVGKLEGAFKIVLVSLIFPVLTALVMGVMLTR